ncbi:Fic family protein [Deinococcus marmoris]|uniref:Fic family protein n=1 Tax=Deinococcus marmoris TaxID=249408 RepID=A0A1U7P0M3_9DEIO|nr:Fic family protein [Deinococcus marmoris]OLV18719.1 Fic family protein [Deinococcus marmoris]
MPRYIHDLDDWSAFHWDVAALSGLLEQVNFRRGALVGQLQVLGSLARQDTLMSAVTDDAVRSSRIEGEIIDAAEVRSSVARRLGLSFAGLPEPSRAVDGVVAMTLDATELSAEPLTAGRLFRWHHALFPGGQSGVTPITTGAYRTDEAGPMQVVGNRLNRPQVHFEAPDAGRLNAEMTAFLRWFEARTPEDPVVKAGLAHLRFLTIHPFEDGNGRIARALTDLQLARADRRSQRYYSLSRQIETHRSGYYQVLERTQRQADQNVTVWLTWFLERVLGALAHTEVALATVRARHLYLEGHRAVALNARQKTVLGRLFEGFEGKLSTQKYVRLVGKETVPGQSGRGPISTDTALRDLEELVQAGMLVRRGQGRGVHYLVPLPVAASGLNAELFVVQEGQGDSTWHVQE